jgi:hypothetical protein
MKVAREKGRGNASATITQTLLAILACSLFVVVGAEASAPSWWSDPGTGSQPAVAAEQLVTNDDDIVWTNYVPNPYAVVTQGQLKQFTARAVDYLNISLTNGAGVTLNTMVSNWAQDYLTNGYNAGNIKPSDYTAITAGQLKYVGSKIWGQLVAGGYTNALPSWLDTNAADTQLANLGQLKTVFNFELTAPTISSLSATAAPGEIDLSWTNPADDTLSGLLVQQQNGDGSWTTLATLSPGTTSYAVMGLTKAGQYQALRVVATTSMTSVASTASNPMDTSGNGLPISWEMQYFGATNVDPNADPDHDGLSNLQEFWAGTDPTNPDTDGNGMLDGAKAVTLNPAMKIPAAPECQYLIIDLGSTSSVGYPAGINDSAQVLLTSAGLLGSRPSPYSASFWSGGTNTPIYSSLSNTNYYDGIVGPLQDGSVYIYGPETYSLYNSPGFWGVGGFFAQGGLLSALVDNATLGASMQTTETLWTSTGATSLVSAAQGVLTNSDDVDAPLPTNPMLPSSVQIALNSSYSTAQEEGLVLSAITGDPAPWGGPMYTWGAITGVNDTHTETFYAFGMTADSSPSLDIAIGAAAYGWRNGVTGTVACSSWGAFYVDYLTDEPTGGLYGGGTNYAAPLLVNNQGAACASGVVNVGGSWTSIPSCGGITDMTETTDAEGPYILGASTNGTTTLWCFNSGALTNVAIRGTPSGGGSSVTGRSISDNLVIPLSGSLWRNSRVHTLSSLCGNPTNWTNLSANLVSPTNALLGGTAFKVSDGALHSILYLTGQITRDGKPINSTNNVICVGQQINLTNIISGVPANAITSYQWAIPGANNTANDTAFYDYEPNATNSCYTNLFTPTNYTTNSYCNFYWSTGGSNQVVYCTNVIYGQTNVISAAFNVLKPEADISNIQGTISVDANFEDGHGVATFPHLHFGRPHDTGDTNVPGMTFTHSSPAFPFTGTYIWIQTLNGDSLTFTAPGKSPLSIVSPPGVDAGRPPNVTFPYDSDAESPGGTQDSPGSPLFASDQTASRSFSATMYLMYRPFTNSLNGDKSVMVPVAAWPWNFSATATNSTPNTNRIETGWYLLNSTPPTTIQDVLTNTEPQWATNADL